MRIIDSDSDSDSDDNVPLSKLRADVAKKADPPIKHEPLIKHEQRCGANGNASIATTIAVVKREAADCDSDSDDNVPISSLAQRKRVKVEPAAAAAKPRATVTSARASPRAPQQQKKKRVKIKFKQQECTEDLYNSLKGRLVQELLCRWWYVVEWPQADMKPPHMHGLQELDGFRGTYIRVKGDDMGSIVETRPQIGKPSFLHFFALPAADIQQLLIKAYEKQMQVLIEHEGADASSLNELKSALASASKISADKAERGVSKILKPYKELAEQIAEIQRKAAQDDNTGTEEDDPDAEETNEDDDEDDD